MTAEDDKKTEETAADKDEAAPAEKPKTTRKPRARKPAARTATETRKDSGTADKTDTGKKAKASAKAEDAPKQDDAGAAPDEGDTAKTDDAAKDESTEDTTVDGKIVSDFDWELRARYGLRFLLAILAGFGVSVSTFLIWVITIVNFIFIMISGEKLEAATSGCSRLSIYVKQLLDFICYKSDKLIFPFAPFPEGSDDGDDGEGVTIDGKAERL